MPNQVVDRRTLSEKKHYINYLPVLSVLLLNSGVDGVGGDDGRGVAVYKNLHQTYVVR